MSSLGCNSASGHKRNSKRTAMDPWSWLRTRRTKLSKGAPTDLSTDSTDPSVLVFIWCSLLFICVYRISTQSVEVRICTSLELQFLLSWTMLGMTFDFMAKDHMLHFCVAGVAIVFGAAWWRHLETALARGASNLWSKRTRAKGSWAEPSWAEPSLSQERLVYEDHIQTLSAADRERRADPSDPTSKLPVMTRNKSQDEIKKNTWIGTHKKDQKHPDLSNDLHRFHHVHLPGSPRIAPG